MKFNKHKRISDKTLLEQVRRLPCLACSEVDPLRALESIEMGIICSHAHHVVSRGAGGGDIASNVMPLCPVHHSMWHNIGMVAMATEFKIIENWLILAGHMETKCITSNSK